MQEEKAKQSKEKQDEDPKREEKKTKKVTEGTEPCCCGLFLTEDQKIKEKLQKKQISDEEIKMMSITR